MIRIVTRGVLTLAVGFAFAITAVPYAPQTVDSDGGKVLKWGKRQIEISISAADTGTLGLSEFSAAVKRSFLSWSAETDLEFTFRFVDESEASSKRSGGDGISLITIAPAVQNLLLFGEKRTNDSAVTRIFYDESGNITEADIVLNPTARFTSDGSPGTFDLQATLTHEAGHFLGLAHSKITGATMHRHQVKNGVFGLPSIYSRTLADDDKSGIRYLYGSERDLNRKYGAVRGMIRQRGGGPLQEPLHVWIESQVDGAAVAGIETDIDGKFSIESVPAGLYRVVSESLDGVFLTLGTSEVRVFEDKVTTIELLVRPERPVKRIEGFGLNSQTATVAVPLEGGNSYFLLLKGRNLDPDRIRIECSSSSVSVDSGSVARFFSRGGFDHLSFEVMLSENIVSGDYSFRIYESEKLISYIPGVVTIGSDLNRLQAIGF